MGGWLLLHGRWLLVSTKALCMFFVCVMVVSREYWGFFRVHARTISLSYLHQNQERRHGHHTTLIVVLCAAR